MEVSIYRVRHREFLAVCVLSLLCLGVLMVQSASTTLSGQLKWGWSQRGMQQLVYAGIAFGAFLLVGHIDYAVLARRGTAAWKSPVLWLTLLAAGLCAAVLVPGVGKNVNGARRWIPLGPTQVQPSEVAKWATVLFLAWWRFASRRVTLWLLFGWGLLNLIGAGLSVIQFPFLPFEPEQSVRHYFFHVVYGAAQLPLIYLMRIRLRQSR